MTDARMGTPLARKNMVRTLAEFQLRGFGRQYHEHPDPFLPWLAYRCARASGLRLPRWAQAYLDRVASALEKLDEAPPSPDALASALARALEMKLQGRGSVFARRSNYRRDHCLAMRVHRLMRDGWQEYLAVELVAKDGPECRAAGFPRLGKKVSKETVGRAYRSHIKARRP